MVPLLLAAVAVSMIHLKLESGAAVQVSYVDGTVSESDAIKLGVGFADYVWKDFCESPGDPKCILGKYYVIYVGIQGPPNRNCDASIFGHPVYSPTAAIPQNFRSEGYYGCYFKEGDPAYHLTRIPREITVTSSMGPPRN